MPPIATTPVRTGTGRFATPIFVGIQRIKGPRRPTIPQKVRNADPLAASINKIPATHRDPIPRWSKIIGSKTFINEIADVYAHGQMNFDSETVLSLGTKFMDLGMSSVDTTHELGYVFASTTRIGSVTHGYDWPPHIHCISEVTSDIVIGTKA